jgi:threonine/homoserine/homoserine lactone efflux protein
MNESRTVFGTAMAVGGALLLAAVVFLICLVLDLSAGLIAVLMVAGAAVGAWYGWRLARGVKLGGSSAGSRRHR